MIDGLRIRQVTADDLPKLEASFSLWKFRLNNLRALEEHEAGRLVWLVADLDGEPVGSVWGELFPEHDRSGRTIHIVAFRVLQSLQRMGVGSALLDALEQAGRAYGRIQATLFVAQENSVAQALYAKAGYAVRDVRFARWEFQDPAGEAHILTEEQFVMAKELLNIAVNGRADQ